MPQTTHAHIDASVEDWGRADSLAQDLAGGGITGRAARRATAATSRHVDQAAEATSTAAVSVLGSGNLGLLYVHSPVRLTLEDLQERWPGLVPGLCAHEGIGFGPDETLLSPTATMQPGCSGALS